MIGEGKVWLASIVGLIFFDIRIYQNQVTEL